MSIVEKAVAAKLQSEGIDWIKVQTLQIDRTEKTVSATLALEGEHTPVAAAASYQLEGNDIVVTEIEVSKPWLGKAAALALAKHGGRFPLPTGMQGSLVRMVL